MDTGTIIVLILILVVLVLVFRRRSGPPTRLAGLPTPARESLLAQLENGQLPVAEDVGIALRRGEVAHLQLEAELMKQVTDREFRGSSQGVSFRLARGVRYHVGASRGKMVIVGSHLQVADRGRLTLTSQRSVFTGLQRTIEIPHAKLVQLVIFNDGVQFHASNRVNPPLFRLGRGDGEVVSAIVNASYQRTLS